MKEGNDTALSRPFSVPFTLFFLVSSPSVRCLRKIINFHRLVFTFTVFSLIDIFPIPSQKRCGVGTWHVVFVFYKRLIQLEFFFSACSFTISNKI